MEIIRTHLDETDAGSISPGCSQRRFTIIYRKHTTTSGKYISGKFNVIIQST